MGTLFVEIAVPTILIIFGLGLTLIQFSFSSEVRTFKISDFPTQRILYNSNGLVVGSIDPQIVISNLDNFTSYEPTSVPISQVANTIKALQQFDSVLASTKNNTPITPY